MLLLLPPELLLKICEHLRRKDLCRFRETCKKHADIVAQPLFETIHLMFLKKSFQNLVAISEHPVLSKFVKSIYYEAMMLELPADREEWEEYIQPPPCPPLSWQQILALAPLSLQRDASPERLQRYRRVMRTWESELQGKDFYTESELSKAWTVFSSIWEQSYEMEQEFDDFSAIFAAFSRMPNIQNMTVVGLCDSEDLCPTVAFSSAYEETLVLPGFLQNGEGNEASAGVRGFESFLRAAVCSGLKIKSLVADGLGWDAFDSQSAFANDYFYSGKKELDLGPIDIAPCAFQWLTSIRLGLPANFSNEDGDTSLIRHSRLGQALRAAESLESMHLEFGQDSNLALNAERDYNPPWFDHIAQQTTWPRLRDFRLEVADTTEEFFVDFIRRHAGLQLLDLGGLWMKTGDWATTLQRIKKHLPNLKSIDFQGNFAIDDAADTGYEVIITMDTNGGLFKKSHPPYLRDYLIAYFLDDGPFPMKTLVEMKETVKDLDELGRILPLEKILLPCLDGAGPLVLRTTVPLPKGYMTPDF